MSQAKRIVLGLIGVLPLVNPVAGADPPNAPAPIFRALRVGRLWKFNLSKVDEWVSAGGADEHKATELGAAA